MPDLNDVLDLAFLLTASRSVTVDLSQSRRTVVLAVRDGDVRDYYAACLDCSAGSVPMVERRFAEHWVCQVCFEKKVGAKWLGVLETRLRALHEATVDPWRLPESTAKTNTGLNSVQINGGPQCEH